MSHQADLAIRTQGLAKQYRDVGALVDLDLEVTAGEVIGYLGPNGAGKTTTIRLLLGLIRPSAGRAQIFGVDCQRRPVETHRRVAVVPGEANLWPELTGAETLHLLGQVHGAVDVVYRDELIDRFELDPSKKVRTYSRGNRQKVLLIGALMTRADLLLMDEPTSGLDPNQIRGVRTLIRDLGKSKTIMISTHILQEVEPVADRVLFIHDGKIVFDGKPDDLARQNGNLEQAFYKLTAQPV